MAHAFRGKFTAFYVETPDFKEMPDDNLERLKKNTRLAEQMGAKIVTSYGSDIVEQIAEYARIARVSKIVLGRTYTRKRFFSVRDSFSDRLTRLAPQLEIFLVPDAYEKKYIAGKKVKIKRTQGETLIPDAVKTLIVMAVATGVARIFEILGLGDANLIMMYILSVLFVSLFTQQRMFSFVYSLASVLIFNFLFVDPVYTLKVDNPGYIITFGIMFLTALISSSLTQKVKKNVMQAAEKSHRTEILLETSQKLQQAGNVEEIALFTARQLGILLGKTIYLFIGSPELDTIPITFCPPGVDEEEFDKGEIGVAQWTYKNSKHAGFSTTTLPGSSCLYLAVRNGEKVFGVVGISMLDKEIPASEEGIMSAILNECALAMEKEELRATQKEAKIRLKQEQLRANLLRSVSHDLRTPLTSISGNAGILIGNADKIGQEAKQNLYLNIYDDSMWLINLVENLLSVTRIENGTMNLNIQAELIGDVISEALRHVNRKSAEHEIRVEEEDDMLVARMDARLIMQVIINLVDNAIAYTEPGSLIQINTRRRKDWVIVEVADTGMGIADEQKKKLFDMFYTIDSSVADGRRGMGLGLALCKSIIQAHGGEITVHDNEPAGTVFRFTLPAEEVILK